MRFLGSRSKFVADIDYSRPDLPQNGRRYLDVYPQTKSDKLVPIIVFVHGGAWGFSSKIEHHLCGMGLQKQGFVAVLVNYSRQPWGDVEDMMLDINAVLNVN